MMMFIPQIPSLWCMWEGLVRLLSQLVRHSGLFHVSVAAVGYYLYDRVSASYKARHVLDVDVAKKHLVSSCKIVRLIR